MFIAIKLASQEGDSIVAVNFEEDKTLLYLVRLYIRGIDRFHLLSDLLNCITEHHISVNRLYTETVDRLVEFSVDFSISSVNSIDKVSRVNIEV